MFPCSSGILLAGLQAEVAAIIFSPASSAEVVNCARESEALEAGGRLEGLVA